jgi:asparagine synthase (glutamine-hydrolysing)
MCGIAGVVSKGGPIGPDAYFDYLQGSLRHRGPDGRGAWIEPNFVLAHTRLAIVDRAHGSQPMQSSTNKNIGIVYNGEIYNYTELRDNLLNVGCKFDTESDTEVVLKMYETYGTDSFEQLNGMFAFCIWDNSKKSLYLARDHAGMKPLYVYEDANMIVFSSEIRTILSMGGVDRSLDCLGFQDYLTFRYVRAPLTLFKNIKRLESGHYLEIHDGKIHKSKYHDLSYNYSINSADCSVLQEQVISTLDEVVGSHLMGEVPVGVLLSGGLDSSTIAYLVSKKNANLTTFNIGYPEVNEFQYLRFVANRFGLKHIEITTTTDEFITDFDTVLCSLDEPIGDPACFPLYELCKELKKHVTVVLSGEGGDETFCGYPQYMRMLLRGQRNPSSFVEFLKQSYYYLNSDQFLAHESDNGYLDRYKSYFDDNSLTNGMMAYDLKTWVPEDLMMKADKIMMAHSLEGRFPFLDKRVMNLAHNIPEHYKIDQHTTKFILKKAMTPYLSEGIVNRQKMGFTVPVDILLTKMKNRVMDTFFSTNVENFLSDVLNIGRIRQMAADYYSRASHPAMQVWTMFILLSWFDEVML